VPCARGDEFEREGFLLIPKVLDTDTADIMVCY